MNTTAGTNTNPTAIALAVIVINVRKLVDANSSDKAMTGAEVNDRYGQIMQSIAGIAERNGNSLGDILALRHQIEQEAALFFVHTTNDHTGIEANGYDR